MYAGHTRLFIVVQTVHRFTNTDKNHTNKLQLIICMQMLLNKAQIPTTHDQTQSSSSLSYLCNPAFELSLLQLPGTSVSGVLQLELAPLLLLSLHLQLHFLQNCLQVQQNPPVLPSLPWKQRWQQACQPNMTPWYGIIVRYRYSTRCNWGN